MKSVFEYLDYRAYLKDFFEERKKQHCYFTYRYFGNKSGVDPSHLHKIILKQRHLSEKSIFGVSTFCDFSGSESKYFHSLVHFSKAKSQRESKLLFERLLSLRHIKSLCLVEEQYEYFSTWYHPVMRSVLEYFDFGNDFALLARQFSPPITAKEARGSVRLLEKLNLIERRSDGGYQLIDGALTTGEKWQSLAIAAYQQQCIRLSLDALERNCRSLRDISTVTMNINEEDFEEICTRITEFRRSIIALADKRTDPNRTYQLNIQFIPLINLKGGTE